MTIIGVDNINIIKLQTLGSMHCHQTDAGEPRRLARIKRHPVLLEPREIAHKVVQTISTFAASQSFHFFVKRLELGDFLGGIRFLKQRGGETGLLNHGAKQVSQIKIAAVALPMFELLVEIRENAFLLF